MNVFVLAPERSGTTTFFKACSHITNYTVAHETNQNSILRHFNMWYPDNHIEIDNRLTFNLGWLDLYHPNAYYVHLQRDLINTATSLSKRYFNHGNVVRGYLDSIIGVRPEKVPDHHLFGVAMQFVNMTRYNIYAFLKGKKHMDFHIDIDPQNSFKKFWDAIGAEGDLNAALAEFQIKHNASRDRVKYLLWWEIKLVLLRLYRKWKLNRKI